MLGINPNYSYIREYARPHANSKPTVFYGAKAEEQGKKSSSYFRKVIRALILGSAAMGISFQFSSLGKQNSAIIGLTIAGLTMLFDKTTTKLIDKLPF